MPYLEYQCSKGHITERFFKTISEGEAVSVIMCPECDEDLPEGGRLGRIAKKIISRPLGFGLYGDPAGYDKPSATKRHSTKVVSAKTGNESSVG